MVDLAERVGVLRLSTWFRITEASRAEVVASVFQDAIH